MLLTRQAYYRFIRSFRKKSVLLSTAIVVVAIMAIGSIAVATNKGLLPRFYSTKKDKDNNSTQIKKSNESADKSTPTPTSTPTPQVTPTVQKSSQSSNINDEQVNNDATQTTRLACDESLAQKAVWNKKQELIAIEKNKFVEEAKQLSEQYYATNPHLYTLYYDQAMKTYLEKVNQINGLTAEQLGISNCP